MKRLKKGLIIIVSFLLILFISFWIYSKIIAHSIDKIILVKADHPYIGKKVDSTLLDRSNYSAFIRDYKIKHPLVFVKFYSCYVIRIYYKNGEMESFRTNGHVLEVLYSSKTNKRRTYAFTLSQNIITKYWNIPDTTQCDEFLILH
jgi:hypothetical protein